jgi:hypothetical protein
LQFPFDARYYFKMSSFQFHYLFGKHNKITGRQVQRAGRTGNNNHVVVSYKPGGFRGHVGERVVMIKEQDLLANSITDTNGVCKLVDCSAMVFVDEFSNFFNIFCHSAAAWSP